MWFCVLIVLMVALRQSKVQTFFFFLQINQSFILQLCITFALLEILKSTLCKNCKTLQNLLIHFSKSKSHQICYTAILQKQWSQMIGNIIKRVHEHVWEQIRQSKFPKFTKAFAIIVDEACSIGWYILYLIRQCAGDLLPCMCFLISNDQVINKPDTFGKFCHYVFVC